MRASSFLWTLLLACVGASLGCGASAPAFTEADLAKVRLGQSEAEVFGVLGEPVPGLSTRQDVPPASQGFLKIRSMAKHTFTAGELTVHVWFQDEKVSGLTRGADSTNLLK